MCICKRAPSFLFSNITDSSARPIFWPWLLSAAQNRCGDLLVTELALCTVCTARDLWMRARPAPTSRPAEATSTSNSIFGENPYEITNFKLFAVHISICEFCEWSYAHTFNTKTPKQPPSPQNLLQGSLFPSYSSLWFECSCLTPINNSPLLRFLAPYHSLGQGLMIIIA